MESESKWPSRIPNYASNIAVAGIGQEASLTTRMDFDMSAVQRTRRPNEVQKCDPISVAPFHNMLDLSELEDSVKTFVRQSHDSNGKPRHRFGRIGNNGANEINEMTRLIKISHMIPNDGNHGIAGIDRSRRIGELKPTHGEAFLVLSSASGAVEVVQVLCTSEFSELLT